MTDIGDMIAESVQRIFSGTVTPGAIEEAETGVFQARLWATVEEAGLTDVLVGDPDDPSAGAWSNVYPVLEAAGYHCVPLPLAETIVAKGLLGHAGLDAPDGPLTFVAGPNAGLKARFEGDGLVLDGQVRAVPWARCCKAIVVEIVADGRAVLAVVSPEAAGLTIENGKNIAAEPRDDLSFVNVSCRTHAVLEETAGGGTSGAELAVSYGALARAALMVGASQRVLSESVRYANDRTQFGKPIGKFQAVQQSLAIMAGEVTSARAAVAAAMESRSPSRFDIAVAKIRAGQAAGVVTNIGHQVHGAIGFTHEHSLHHATRRLWSWRAESGSDAMWAKELGESAIVAGGRSFWRDLTRQS